MKSIRLIMGITSGFRNWYGITTFYIVPLPDGRMSNVDLILPMGVPSNRLQEFLAA